MERGLTTFNNLIVGDRVFRIPMYQRNYSWEEKQLEDLWEDLLYLDMDKKHYFGTVITKPTGETKESPLKSFSVYEIIDGQQRITSVLILLRVIISNLEIETDEKLLEEINDIRKSYFEYKGIHKMELLGDDKDFFETNVMKDEDYPDETLTPSQRRLRTAKSFFREKLKELKDDCKHPGDFVTVCRNLKKKIDDLEIIAYPANDDSDAVLIFETVNDRGKDLTNLERTKSFLMHMIYLAKPKEESPEPDLREVNDRFGRIFRYIEQITNAERGQNVNEDDIQRYHFVAFEPNAKGARKLSHGYLDYIKRICRDSYKVDTEKCLKYVMDYSRDLEKAFYSFREVVTHDKDDGIGGFLNRIFFLDRVAGFFPLIMAAWIRFKDERIKLEKILSLLEVYSMRLFAIGRRRVDTGEGDLYRLAFRTYNDELTFGEIIDELRGLVEYYESDTNFESDLKVDYLYDRIAAKDIRYLFLNYEEFLRKKEGEPLNIDLRDIQKGKFEIEHIWCQSPKSLSEKEEDEHEDSVNKLGNLTLASKGWNARWGNSPFIDKKKGKHGYEGSLLRVQKELADLPYTEWHLKQIEEREAALVNFAQSRWRF